jgi:hypothetical protein
LCLAKIPICREIKQLFCGTIPASECVKLASWYAYSGFLLFLFPDSFALAAT